MRKQKSELLPILAAIVVFMLVLGCIHLPLCLLLDIKPGIHRAWQSALVNSLAISLSFFALHYVLLWFRLQGRFDSAKNLPFQGWFSVGALQFGGFSFLSTWGLFHTYARDQIVPGIALACLLGLTGTVLGFNWQKLWNV